MLHERALSWVRIKITVNLNQSAQDLSSAYECVIKALCSYPGVMEITIVYVCMHFKHINLIINACLL